MKILVTGGAGFIGSNFLHYMVNKYPKYNFVCLDALTYAGNYANLYPILDKKNFKFIKENITNKIEIDKIFAREKFDWVVNFAAESHVDNSIKNPQIFLETNIIGTQVLLDASLKYQVKRYHQISTDEVYGDLPLDNLNLKFDENSPINPSSPYSASKAAADLLVSAYVRTYNLSATISRCSNNYGPYQFPEKLIPVVITKAMNNEKIPVYGKGLNIRDWIHVSDHNIAVDLILHNGTCGEIYNIGGNGEMTNIDLVKTILEKMEKNNDLIEYVSDRKGHDLRYSINPAKIENELKWKKNIDFEKGISDTINWYLNNEEWLENIKSGKYKDLYAERK